MSIKVAIRHHTQYQYDRAVNLSPHIFRLRPAPHCRTPILSYTFKVHPEKHFINWQQDPFGNYQARLVFPEQTTSLQFDTEVIADIVVINPFDFFIESYAEKFPFEYTHQLGKELQPYTEIKEHGPLLSTLVKNMVLEKKSSTIDFLVHINQRLWDLIKYTIRFEPGIQSCEETLNLQKGSCRDSAWLFVQVARHLGLAARFVSGYLVQLKADSKALDGPSGPEEDFTDLHAWAEIYIPGAGWIGLDPTSGLFAGEGHIPLCCTPDPVSAAPVTGLTDVCEVEFSYRNEVVRIHEDPRVTKPYSEEQWRRIMQLGNEVDETLTSGDVRLTMGGEPTFVSVDDMEAKEWNTIADGPQKRVLGNDLIVRLREAFAPGGFVHKGQGKWYPGEPLPRWQCATYWRKDGYPIWKNPALIDTQQEPSSYSVEQAHQMAQELVQYLNLSEDNIHPAFEDAFFFLWEEKKVPVNIDPYSANLNDPEERHKLVELLAKGLGNPVGYIIPLAWNFWNNTWVSCQWEFRNGKLILIPGNSPMGYRLPLKSLPFMKEEKKQRRVERSPFEELSELELFHEQVETRYKEDAGILEYPREFYEYPQNKGNRKDQAAAVKSHEAKHEPTPQFEMFSIITALCIEIRKGTMHVFMPPLSYAEHYLDLLACIEGAAEKLNVKVVIEGYEPPHDRRLTKLSLSPDPGVLEVNIHPSSSWEELVKKYDILFEEARQSRLVTEKFMLDGKHTGTGGGNHITIGGITPEDSPLLRRPDLLRSLIIYWQHHPGLSYLFSTQFIGPTSQAPRVDEGRQEILYELEIAFNQIPEEGEMPFWLVDRVFRNLLVDITGNTHRAEFCIDKLYSPDTATGRLGLLEFRAFDMPPNKQMCITQLLLIRCIIAMFWKKPLNRKLIRWGTELHDKYLLPHFVHQDLKEVMLDLQEAGIPFDMSWLDPFFEFRFPLHGKILVEGMELQLRMGIEPWHVLGEEVSSGGTARFVDSSVERVEVIVKNFNKDRYVLACHGIPIHLWDTPIKGEFVAGVRYRAWNPPSALHPTLGTDVPLVFDVVDTWNNKSVGGCVYHVAHPGGRNYDTFPVNAFEAEGRRVSRFWKHGHTPGTLTPKVPYKTVTRYVEARPNLEKSDFPLAKINPEFPHTLDLRQY